MIDAAQGAVGEAFRDYLAAIRAGDRRAAFGAIDAAREARVDLGSLYIEVFQPAMREIGRL